MPRIGKYSEDRVTSVNKNYFTKDGTKIIDTRGLGICRENYEADQREAVGQLYQIFREERVRGIIIVIPPSEFAETMFNEQIILDELIDFFEDVEKIPQYANASIGIVIPYDYVPDNVATNKRHKQLCYAKLGKRTRYTYTKNLESTPLFSPFHTAKTGEEKSINATHINKEKVIAFSAEDKDSIEKN